MDVDLDVSLSESAYGKLTELCRQMGGATKNYVLNLVIENAKLHRGAVIKVTPPALVDYGKAGTASIGIDFLETIKLMLKGEVSLKRVVDDESVTFWDGDGPVIGWIDQYVNLYPSETFKHARESNKFLGSSNAIYQELRDAGCLAMTGENGRVTKKRIGPDGKQYRVLVLKPEVLNIKAGGMR